MSIFSMIFGTDKPNNVGSSIQLLNGYRTTFSDFNGRLYDVAQVRACIDAIARNGAKLHPKHIRSNNSRFENLDGNIQRLIAQRPNELMNAYDFYYKVISELYLNNNAFVYISRDENGVPVGLYPIKGGMYSLLEYKGSVYIKFNFTNGKSYTASLKDDVIHLKRFFCEDEIVGGNSTPIIKTMSLKHIINEGLANAIKTTQSIKGVLKTEKSMLKPSDLRRMRDDFVTDFVNGTDKSGIASLDATMSFNPVNLSPLTATDSQIKLIDAEILNYYGVNEDILQSKYNEDTWNSFYESVLEPIALMLGLEFTNKLFSVGERYHGNKIVFESNRLQYASARTKIEIARYMNNYMTINEIREIFNLAPIEDGDKIMQDLNHIDSDIADDYQGGNNE